MFSPVKFSVKHGLKDTLFEGMTTPDFSAGRMHSDSDTTLPGEYNQERKIAMRKFIQSL